jgi:tight adherence protein B
MNPVVIIAVLIVLVVMGMVVALIMANDRQRQARTMNVIRGQVTADSSHKGPKDDQDRRRAEIARKLKEQSDGDDKKKASLARQLEQAGINMKVPQFVAIFAVLAFLVTALCYFQFKLPMVACPIIGLCFFFGAQRIFISRKIKKRQKKFLTEFADALEAMVRLLKAGMPVSEAIKMSSREFVGPVGEEMSRIYDAQKIGVPLPEAVLEAARRMPLTEMQMFATGISIQAQTGSSLSDVLMNLAGVIRSRFKLKRKIQALSSEAKASAMIIGSLPFLVGGGMMLINPDFISPLITTFAGKVMLAFCAVWMFAGCMVMKIMINFKI